MAARAD
jgi:hypothetical protein